jgi:L-threonylcarbamoyladenylate synthase
VSLLASAGLDTLALRVPRHDIAQALLSEAGLPIAAPSANRSGQLSATRAQHVADDFGDALELILDGGATPLGIESTIIGFDGPAAVLLRPGAIPRESIEALVGPLQSLATNTISAPGQLRSHYAPRTPLRLNAGEASQGEALLAFGPVSTHPSVETRNLSPGGDLLEAAANLFAMLHELDAAGAACIAVSAIPAHGLGEAINDRLRRAAAPRED